MTELRQQGALIHLPALAEAPSFAVLLWQKAGSTGRHLVDFEISTWSGKGYLLKPHGLSKTLSTGERALTPRRGRMCSERRGHVSVLEMPPVGGLI